MLMQWLEGHDPGLARPPMCVSLWLAIDGSSWLKSAVTRFFTLPPPPASLHRPQELLPPLLTSVFSASFALSCIL